MNRFTALEYPDSTKSQRRGYAGFLSRTLANVWGPNSAGNPPFFRATGLLLTSPSKQSSCPVQNVLPRPQNSEESKVFPLDSLVSFLMGRMTYFKCEVIINYCLRPFQNSLLSVLFCHHTLFPIIPVLPRATRHIHVIFLRQSRPRTAVFLEYFGIFLEQI